MPFLLSAFVINIDSARAKSFSAVAPHMFRKGNIHPFFAPVDRQSVTETFAFWLEKCEDVRALRRLHASFFTRGLGDDIYLGSKLLNRYALMGVAQDARSVYRRIINRNLSLWNSAAVSFFRAGHFEEVLRLYTDLKSSGIGIGGSALTFSLKSCAELGVIQLGSRIHADAIKIGLNGEGHVGTSLIGLYSWYASVEQAHQAFDEILKKDVVACTAMVTAYAQSNGQCVRRAFDVVRYMKVEGLDPNRVTLVSLLQAVGQVGALEVGTLIHSYAMRRGMGVSDEVFETSLLDMYIKCASKNRALSIFNRMKERPLASCNAMIAGLVRRGQPSEALAVYYQMRQKENIIPDGITLANLLAACNDLKCIHLAASIQAYILRMGITLDLVLKTALIVAYSRCHKIKKARVLFDELMTRDVVSYNAIVSGYLLNGAFQEACNMIGEMVKEGFLPNSATILNLLCAVSDYADVRMGKCIHGHAVRRGLHSTLEISNQLLHMYAKCGYANISREIFSRICTKDLVSWASMMMVYVNYGHPGEAVNLFQLMQRAGEKADPFTLSSLLQACSQLGCLRVVKEIHGLIYRSLFSKDITVSNCIIMTYSKCGRLDISEIVFNNMLERVHVTWNTMIAAYAMHGCFSELIKLFHQMQKENMKPDEVTFTSILSACSHSGQVDDGWRIFNSMNTEHAVTPNDEHHTCMVDLLARAGHLEEAFYFLEQSPLRNNHSALSSLLSACRIHGDTNLGEIIGRKLLHVSPHKSSSYSLISNICADAGDWSKAATIRALPSYSGFRKIPGYSLIEFGN